jgi:integrase/recombinase XerD
LKDDNLNIPELYASIIGKGNKHGIITFSETAALKLNEYLAVREQYFPDTAFRYIFTLYEKGSASMLTEQKLNIALKQIAKRAGVQQNVYAHLFRHSLATHLLED